MSLLFLSPVFTFSRLLPPQWLLPLSDLYLSVYPQFRPVLNLNGDVGLCVIACVRVGTSESERVYHEWQGELHHFGELNLAEMIQSEPIEWTVGA